MDKEDYPTHNSALFRIGTPAYAYSTLELYLAQLLRTCLFASGISIVRKNCFFFDLAYDSPYESTRFTPYMTGTKPSRSATNKIRQHENSGRLCTTEHNWALCLFIPTTYYFLIILIIMIADLRNQIIQRPTHSKPDWNINPSGVQLSAGRRRGLFVCTLV